MTNPQKEVQPVREEVCGVVWGTKDGPDQEKLHYCPNHKPCPDHPQEAAPVNAYEEAERLAQEVDRAKLNATDDAMLKAAEFIEEVAEKMPIADEKPLEAAPGDWEARLQFEVMEDYLRDAEHRYAAKDQKEHMERMRGHWEKLQSFIRQLIRRKEREVRFATVEGFQNYLLKHGYCDADVYAEETPDGHENAIAGYLASLKAHE